MSDDWEEALSSPGDPWSSREVDRVSVKKWTCKTILRFVGEWRMRACAGEVEELCIYAADFEIRDALLPLIPEGYEGEIRRQTRILRKRKELITVDKKWHRHFNPDTSHWVQVHRLPPKVPPSDGAP